jgi:hypothetical protein
MTLSPYNTYVLIDTETGGTDPSVHSLLSVCLMLVSISPTEIKALDSIYLETKPANRNYVVEAGGLEVNKINLVEHDKIAKPYKSVSLNLSRWLHETIPLTGYSFGQRYQYLGWAPEFDVLAMKTHIYDTATDRGGLSGRMFSRATLDVKSIALLHQSLGLLPPGLNISLVDVAKHFNLDVSKAHNSKWDCYLTLEVLKNLVNQQTNQQRKL